MHIIKTETETGYRWRQTLYLNDCSWKKFRESDSWTIFKVFIEAKFRVEKYWKSKSVDSEDGWLYSLSFFSTLSCLFLVSQFQFRVLIAQNLILLFGIYCFLEFIATFCFSQFLELPLGTELQFKVHEWKSMAPYNILKNEIELHLTSYKN